MSGYLIYGDSYKNPNVYYATGFMAPDPIFFVSSDAGETLAVPPLERGRAEKEARQADVRSFEELGYQQALDESGKPALAMASCIERLLREDGPGPFRVESTFPVLLADALRARGIELVPDADLLRLDRRHKTSAEVNSLERSQKRSEQAVSDAIEIIRESQVVNGNLVYRGVPLTAERIRGELDVSFARDGFMSDGTIVAPGPRGADPHWSGAGQVRANEPIILDIFPMDRATRYYGDITRTVLKGTPPPEILRMFGAVQRAQDVALAMIRPGVNGREVHQAVIDSFASDGFDGNSQAKYIHGTGHGLGLEVHELPSMGRVDMMLEEGDVVTVEPGLYDPELGGVRLEDVVVLTADGNRNLNTLAKELVVE